MVVALALGIVAATALTDRTLGPISEMARNAVGTGGLLALAAVTLGAGRAWIPPAVWALAAPRLVYEFWPGDQPGYAQIITWPTQPASSDPAVITAVILGVAGTAVYAIFGPRP